MKPGQVSMGLGVLGAVRPDGGIGALSLRATAPVHERVQIDVLAGVFAAPATAPGASGTKISARDVQLRVPVLAIDEPDLQLRVAPGVSLPLGSASSGLGYTLLTTGSFDPTLSASLAAGGTWLVLVGGTVRVPLHPGFDRIQQGVYGLADVRVARRFGPGAGFAGVSFAGQQARGLTSPGFVELAPVLGATYPLGDRWGADAGLRVPVWTGESARPYYAALQIGVTRVLGKRASQH
ncbi:MAG: hypothetical protein R3F61_15350 [Myxococcota bacterium]